MSAYLAYLYSVNLKDEERIKVDSRVKDGQKDFSKGFKKGMILSLSMYPIFLLVQPVTAVDVPPGKPDLNVSPEPAPTAPPGNPGAVAPFVKGGTTPLGQGVKGTFVGGAGSICAAFFQSGDFLLGLSCAFLIVIGAVVINRTPHE